MNIMPIISKRKKIRFFIYSTAVVGILQLFGVFTHLFEKDFYTEFHYPYDGDIELSVYQLRNNIDPQIKPINYYYFKYIINIKNKCDNVFPRLVYIIKSAPENFNRRIAIRSSWGYQGRFSDVDIRTVFLIGEKNDAIQSLLNEESKKFTDIIQGNFTDSYYNNTLKTMLGWKWVIEFCSKSKYYMFVDDDYYVSTKNVLRFLRNPTNYPQYLKEPVSIRNQIQPRKPMELVADYDIEDNVLLYAGYVFNSSPHRHISSTWYVPLKEYPYHMWPPYVTAGAYILSKEALMNMYYTSFYTQHFKFDDIYLGLLAYKSKIEPFHHDEFKFYEKKYPGLFEYVIAAHGFGNEKHLLKTWSDQRSLGNA